MMPIVVIVSVLFFHIPAEQAPRSPGKIPRAIATRGSIRAVATAAAVSAAGPGAIRWSSCTAGASIARTYPRMGLVFGTAVMKVGMVGWSFFPWIQSGGIRGLIRLPACARSVRHRRTRDIFRRWGLIIPRGALLRRSRARTTLRFNNRGFRFCGPKSFGVASSTGCP